MKPKAIDWQKVDTHSNDYRAGIMVARKEAITLADKELILAALANYAGEDYEMILHLKNSAPTKDMARTIKTFEKSYKRVTDLMEKVKKLTTS